MIILRIFSFSLIFFFNTLIAQSNIQEEVIITGSLIENTRIASPVYLVSDEELKRRGSFRVEDFLNHLPQINPGNSALHSNFASGTASVSIRGLGGNRSLIMVGGKRLPLGSPLDGHAEQDLNQIPDSLIKRVEILTGGKSTLYGSDAIGGVINFILDRNFSGANISMHQGIYQHENNNKPLRSINDSAKGSVLDGLNSSYSFVAGDEVGQNTHLVGYIDYKSIESIRWDDRDIGVCAFRGNASCRLSSATYMARVQNGSNGGYVSNSGFSSTSNGFNFGAANFLQRPDKKRSIGFLLSNKISKNSLLSIDFFNTSSESTAQIGAPLIFRQIVPIPCSNPYLSSSQYSSIGCTSNSDTISSTLSKRFVENSLNRAQLFKSSSSRGVIKLDGKLNNNWQYSFSFQNSHTSIDYRYLNDLSLSKIRNSLNISSSGACVSNDPGCVPLNLFTTSNLVSANTSQGITQAALDYIHLNLKMRGELTDKQYFLSFSKEFELNSSILESFSLLYGIEKRDQRLNKNPDESFLNQDGAGQQIFHDTMIGSQDVNDIFTQINLPFKSGLDINASIRFSDYSLGKEAFTYDYGLIYQINNYFTLKASHQKSLRVADLHELFDPEETELRYAVDPCAGSSPSLNSTKCSYTGVTSLYGSIDDTSAQLYAQGSGNLNLDPEEAISNSLSLEADFGNGLITKLDFFEINMDNQISSLSIATVLDNCVVSADSTGYWCSLINRASDMTLSTSGSFVSTPNYNLSKFSTKGFDLALGYSFNSSIGEVSLSNLTNFISKKSFQVEASKAIINCRGFYRNGDESGLCYQPSPKLQNILNISLSSNILNMPFDSGLTVRYIDDVKDAKSLGTTLNIPFSSFTYLDANFNVNIKDDLKVYFGINNLLDRDPPVNGYIGYVPGNANTYPAFYDSLGRFIFLKISLDLD
jgi:outer membrane receptor protein involved in Fe transport